jgi:16S rRNA processing protein RimM
LKDGKVTETNSLISVGRILRAHGVHGAVLASIYGEAPLTIINAKNLFLLPKNDQADTSTLKISDHKGKVVPAGVILKFKNITNRDEAQEFKGRELAVNRSELPEAEIDEYYQTDLLGLKVQTTAGNPLGQVINLLDTGADLILVIADENKHEFLVPFNDYCVPKVDLITGQLWVEDWPELLDINK